MESALSRLLLSLPGSCGRGKGEGGDEGRSSLTTFFRSCFKIRVEEDIGHGRREGAKRKLRRRKSKNKIQPPRKEPMENTLGGLR